MIIVVKGGFSSCSTGRRVEVSSLVAFQVLWCIVHRCMLVVARVPANPLFVLESSVLTQEVIVRLLGFPFFYLPFEHFFKVASSMRVCHLDLVYHFAKGHPLLMRLRG